MNPLHMLSEKPVCENTSIALTTPMAVMPISICAVEIWQWSGYHMTIYLAGLKSIPRELYESAYMDGAGAWQRLRGVTLPLVLPAFNVSLVLSLIGGMKVFTQVFILTEGGPGNASQVMYTYVYEAFADGRWAVGNAVNLALFLIIAVLALTVLSRWFWLRGLRRYSGASA